MAEKQGFVLAFCKAVRVKYFMLCKSLRSAAKNDAPCRFLNALVQIPVVKCRKTKTDKRVCLSVISIGETEICSCLLQSSPCKIFLCFAKAFGQPLKTTHRVVFLTLSFKSLLLSVVKQKRTSEFACPLYPSEKQRFVK